MILLHQDNVAGFAGAHTYYWLPNQLLLRRIAAGKQVAEAVASSAGVATVTGVGAATATADGASAGVATVNGVGVAIAAGVGSSAGVATVDGISPTFVIIEADGLAVGQATVFGVSPAVAGATGGWIRRRRITAREREFLQRLGRPTAPLALPAESEIEAVIAEAVEAEPSLAEPLRPRPSPVETLHAYLETLEREQADLRGLIADAEVFLEEAQREEDDMLITAALLVAVDT